MPRGLRSAARWSPFARAHKRIVLPSGPWSPALVLADGRVIAADLASADSLAPTASPIESSARAVLIAAGGAGQVYSDTTNPAVATGDGIALAAQAGAELADMEFYQFHPTALSLPGVPRFLLSEALRGEGAYLRNDRGERFMERYHPLLELAPRDVVARAIAREGMDFSDGHRRAAFGLSRHAPHPRASICTNAFRASPLSWPSTRSTWPATSFPCAPRRITSWAASRQI
jgi:L-aspartate oxidase